MGNRHSTVNLKHMSLLCRFDKTARALWSYGRVFSLSKYEISGSHILWKVLIDPLVKYLIFSNFRNSIRSLSQTETFGGLGDFHFRTILLRARREAKAKAFL